MGTPEREVSPSDARRGAHASRQQLGPGPWEVGNSLKVGLLQHHQRSGRCGAVHEQGWICGNRRRVVGRRFALVVRDWGWNGFKNDVRIGATKAEGGDTGQYATGWPLDKRSLLGDDLEVRAFPVHVRVWVDVVQGWWHASVMKAKAGLDQPDDARARLKVSDVGLHSAEQHLGARVARCPVGSLKRGELDSITK